MKIFVIGHSLSGKSSLSALISSEFGYKVISAGGWVRSAFGETKPTRKEMDDYSCKVLGENPNACIEYILGQVGEEEKILIEGIRNPRDFIVLYEPGDIVIFLKINPIIEDSEFELRGVKAIQSYLDFVSLTSKVNRADIVLEVKIDGMVINYAASTQQIFEGIKNKFNGLLSVSN